MICFATLNIQKAGASKVNALIDLMFDEAFPIDVLCVQELDLDELSAPAFLAMLRGRGLHVFLSPVDGEMYRCAVLAKFAGSPVDLCSGRLAGAVFELLCNGSVTKVVVASYYGCTWNSEVAMQGAIDAVAELKKTRAHWVMLGDFNLEQFAEPMAANLASGFAWAWDDDFQELGPLPATRASGRRLDYALGCGRFFPGRVQQRWVFSDHAQVAYTVDLQDPVGHRAPGFRGLSTSPVSASSWDAVWDEARFQAALVENDVNEAWKLLSNVAEDLLSARGAAGPRRSTFWRPSLRAHPRSKAAGPQDPLLVVRLRRLLRRLAQLHKVPGDCRLRDKIARQAASLQPQAPWLQELPHFGMEGWCGWLEDRISELEHRCKTSAISAWRGKMESSEPQLLAWIQRRERLNIELARPALSADEVHQGCAIHPTRVLQDSEAAWMRLWGRRDVTGGVRALLGRHPQLPEYVWRPTFTADELRKVAKAMSQKAAGPDGWSTASWCLLPDGFFAALAHLWGAVVSSGVTPDLWRLGRVVLLAKPSGGHRPLTILPCAWRVGCRLLVQQLAGWIDSWATHRTLGGVCRRGVRDSFLRIVDSLDQPSLYVQEDLTKFFDSIRIPDLTLTLERLGAPRLLVQLLQGFYRDHHRVFSFGGVVGASWKQVHCGIAQGCPLSPALAGAVMAVWSAVTEWGAETAVSTVSFVDDRLLWAADPVSLLAAKRRSSDFDRAYGFSCDRLKSRFVHRRPPAEVAELTEVLDYEVADSLSLLGVVVPLDKERRPYLKDFNLQKALRRLRLIGVAARGLLAKKRLLSVLVVPMLTWAGGFATVPAETHEELVSSFRVLLSKDLAADTPSTLCYEVCGWEVHPGFAATLAALRQAVLVHTRQPVWIEEASLRLATKKWPQLLPYAVEALETMAWWHDPSGRFFFRRDSYGHTRRFELGVDAIAVLAEWLRDFYRVKGFNQCTRVVKTLKRQGQQLENLGQGLDLPRPPPGFLATCAGHKWAWSTSSSTLERNCALVTGCSAWHKEKKQKRLGQGAPDCLCGKRFPSRPHLLWNCVETAAFVAEVPFPTDRLQERLLACRVPEVPACPVVLDYHDYVDELSASLQACLLRDGTVFLATDGSVFDTVAAWAVVLDNDGGVFSLGVDAEDQSPYRAETEGLIAVVRALHRCTAAGCVHVLADCQAALTTLHGGGASPLLSRPALQMQAEMRGRIELHWWWVPSHGKIAPSSWRVPPCGEMKARALNAQVDRAARDCATRRASGSDRQRCCQQRAAAFEWERKAHLAFRQVADCWANA